ncbi:MAG: cyclodeaminase/cyclohydrolase family protein [Clostridia bacterium]|nr:cyclodeaminase/cyclohydrolase family protein [Clostridia bacterium]MBP5272431.1 cyclodeaminase/cyclohydrolase family protein [Clostridia bacterium]
MLNNSLDSFSAKLASAAPTPGGGGAAALAGALAIALGNMVGSLTVGKKKYADVEDRIIELNGMAEELRHKLLAQMDEDAKAFEPLSRAYGIPKDDPDRDETLEKCLHAAAEPPMNILRLSCEAMDLIAEYAEKGSRLVISDAGCAAAMAEAAIRSAALNVAINTRLMKDRDYAEKMNEELDALMAKYVPLAEETYETVYGGLK